MAIDWNADVGDLLKQLFSSESSATVSKPEGVGMAMAIPALLVMSVVMFFFLVYRPLEGEIGQMQTKVDKIPELGLKQIELKVLHKKSDKEMEEATARRFQIHQMMFAHKEIDQLYRKVQEWAKLNQLKVVTLRKIGVTPVTAMMDKETTKRRRGKGQNEPAPLFYRIELMLKIRGEFLNYLKLRDALNSYEKMLQVNSEQIRAVRILNRSLDGDALLQQRGQVEVEMVLSTYQSDEKRFEENRSEQ